MYEKKSWDKVVYHNGFEIFKDHDAVPIEGVAEAMGIFLKPNGSGGYRINCPCPDHNDNNPSVDITTSGKFENTFKCWSCGEHGGPLELVIAINSGLAPSKYWDMIRSRGQSGGYDKQDYYRAIKARDDAAIFLNSLYPGLIRIDHIENGKVVGEEEGVLKRPELPSDIWEELKDWVNLDRSVGIQKRVLIKDSPKSEPIKIQMDGLDDYAYASLIYGKLCETQDCLRAYRHKIFYDFPKLDGSGKLTISEGIQKRIERIQIYVTIYRDYLNKVYDRDYPMIDPFREMAEQYTEEEEEKDLDEKG